MSTAAPRRVHLFLLVTLVLMGLVAGQHAKASVVCFSSAAVCNVVDEPDVTLGWAPPSSATPVDHYAVEISWNGGVFELNPSWATQKGTYYDTQQWFVGEFNGDGRDDLVKIFEDQQKVSIDAYSSNGSSFTRERWATQQGLFDDSQSWLAGDYNEDGTDDLAVISNDAGKISIDVYR
jgi:hypothetical protein